MDDRVIKAALDKFEQDDFLGSKELLQGQIRQAKNDYIKTRLGLKNDLDPVATVEEPEETVIKAPEEDGTTEEPITEPKKKKGINRTKKV